MVLVEFEKPVSIALINIYNYLKDPPRATKEIDIYLDNYIIYSGNLNHPSNNQLSSILFSSFVKKSRSRVIPVSLLEEVDCVELVDEGRVVREKKIASHIQRPFTGKFD